MANARTLQLKTAIGPYPHVMALKDGSVTVPGVEFEHVELNYVDIFRRMARDLAFDVSLMSVISYLGAKDHGIPFTALPIVVNAQFHHRDFIVNKHAGIKTPKDLEGKKVGTRTYTVTPGTLDRGILSDEFGVDLWSITWVCAELEHVTQCQSHLPPNVIPGTAAAEDLFPRIASGEIPAGIAGSNLRGGKSDDVVPLFPNAVELDRAYYQRTGIVQPFQIIVVKDAVLSEHPGIAEALYKAFKEAKAQASVKAEGTLKAVLGDADPLPYGREVNRKGFEEAIRLATEQKIISKTLTVDEIFPDLN